MFGKKDDTYDELREKSISQWLDQMSHHEDVVVRGGVKVTQEYIEGLHKKIDNLEKKHLVKDQYLKKMKLATQDQ